MNFNEYLAQIKSKFVDAREISINDIYSPTVIYEEFFKWKWMATKLKMFSFILYVDEIKINQMTDYSSTCLKYAIKNKKGLPIGLQNGVVSINILVSENVSQSAVDFAVSRPPKHFSAFEFPVIVDLSKNEIYYYKDKIIWGALYDTFIKNYTVSNFNIV